jgi:hypothetical protein
MAARKKLTQTEETRKKIQVSQLINRLQNHIFNNDEIKDSQIKAIDILLKKALPDLARSEITGKDGEAIKSETKITNAGDVVLGFIEEYKPVKKLS